MSGCALPRAVAHHRAGGAIACRSRGRSVQQLPADGGRGVDPRRCGAGRSPDVRAVRRRSQGRQVARQSGRRTRRRRIIARREQPAGSQAALQPSFTALSLSPAGEGSSSTTLALAILGTLLVVSLAGLESLIVIRGLDRTRELSIRAALGASRRQLLRHLLVEHTVLGGIALFGALVTLSWLIDTSPLWATKLGITGPLARDWAVLGTTIAVTGGLLVLASCRRWLPSWPCDHHSRRAQEA